MPDLNAARVEAVRLTGELLKEVPRRFWDDQLWELYVTDDSGLTLFSLHFSATDAPATSRDH